MTRTHPHARARAGAITLAAIVAVLTALALHAAPAAASSRQASLIQDGVALNENPVGDMSTMRELGANTVRVLLFWYQVAPSPNAKRPPKGFTASNPGSYPAANWAQWDAIVRTAKAEGLRVDLDIAGAPPDWAQGKDVPAKYDRSRFGWEVNAADYGQFVRAVATRYDGHYTPTGATSPLPKVSLYSLWNEPNNGQDLGPQNVDATSKSSGYGVAPLYFRNLLRAGWAALKQDAKGATVLVGEYAGTGKIGVKNRKHPYGLPGQVSISSPATFIQELYCLDSDLQPLTGEQGKLAGCPTGRARGSFVKDNPALFDASAVSMHPYASHYTPTANPGSIPKNVIVFPVISRLTTELGEVTRAWHHPRRYSVWSTEFGYQTSPPQTNRGGKRYPSPAQAAIYLNQADYISYHNPRLASYAQYLLEDPDVLSGDGLFSSGLITDRGVAKPGFDAYRMPVWMPEQSVAKGQNALIWGGARPAPDGYQATHTAQRVEIQLRTGGTWRTIDTVTVNRTTGYFNARVRFTTGGSLRLAYTYPATELALPAGIAGSTVYSRTIPVTVH